MGRAPAAIQQRSHGPISDQQQDQSHRQWPLCHQQASQMIHQYGAASRQLERDEKDGDAKQAGQQQLDAGT
ncbi:hypothetical protein KAM461_24310 [Aeromonas hydrophila]|nr:hypothetical protein KAM461_24310 [Aeromonas hydrophila]